MALLSQKEQDALIIEHMPYAESGAMKHLRMSGGKADKDALLSAAYAGLVIAARKFDNERGSSFKNHAFNWIEQQLRKVYMEERRANGWSYQHNVESAKAGGKGMQKLAQRTEFPTYADTRTGEALPVDLDSGEPNPETLLLYQEALEQREVERQRTRATDLSRAKNDREALIVTRLHDGITYDEIAVELGCTRQNVWIIAKRLGVVRHGRKREERVVPMVDIDPSETGLPPMPRADASAEIEQRLLRLDVGQTISYESIAFAINRDIHDARGIMTTVRQRILLEHGRVFGPIPHVGLRRLNDSEVLSVASKSTKAIARSALRGLRVLASVRDFDGLSNDEKLRHHTVAAQLGMLAHVTSEATTKRVEERMAAAQHQLPAAALLEAIRETL